jgi:hypothetical protein
LLVTTSRVTISLGTARFCQRSTLRAEVSRRVHGVGQHSSRAPREAKLATNVSTARLSARALLDDLVTSAPLAIAKLATVVP